MELQDLLNQDEEKLFEDYLNTPTVTHSKDRQRFVAYALVARFNESGFTEERKDKLREKGLSQKQIDKLQELYEWTADVLEVLR